MMSIAHGSRVLWDARASASSLSALLPHALSARDRAAVPHPALGEAVRADLLGLGAELLTRRERFGSVVRKSAHDVRGEAHAIVLFIQVRRAHGALAARRLLRFLRLPR